MDILNDPDNKSLGFTGSCGADQKITGFTLSISYGWSTRCPQVEARLIRVGLDRPRCPRLFDLYLYESDTTHCKSNHELSPREVYDTIRDFTRLLESSIDNAKREEFLAFVMRVALEREGLWSLSAAFNDTYSSGFHAGERNVQNGIRRLLNIGAE